MELSCLVAYAGNDRFYLVAPVPHSSRCLFSKFTNARSGHFKEFEDFVVGRADKIAYKSKYPVIEVIGECGDATLVEKQFFCVVWTERASGAFTVPFPEYAVTLGTLRRVDNALVRKLSLPFVPYQPLADTVHDSNDASENYEKECGDEVERLRVNKRSESKIPPCDSGTQESQHSPHSPLVPVVSLKLRENVPPEIPFDLSPPMISEVAKYPCHAPSIPHIVTLCSKNAHDRSVRRECATERGK